VYLLFDISTAAADDVYKLTKDCIIKSFSIDVFFCIDIRDG
jgi:hypothetical protein